MQIMMTKNNQFLKLGCRGKCTATILFFAGVSLWLWYKCCVGIVRPFGDLCLQNAKCHCGVRHISLYLFM